MRIRGTLVLAALSMAAAIAPSVAAAQPGGVTPAVLEVANWSTATGDNGGLPFMVLDKSAAAVFLYDGSGRLLGVAPVLIGTAIGDDSAPGIGNREMHTIKPEERTTPAGRFVAYLGPALGKYRQVLWVSFADSIALHPVITSNPREQRNQRLNSPSPGDNRITYGCINVSSEFYQRVVQPLFAKTAGIAYVLPESRRTAEVIPGFSPILAAQQARAEVEERR
jgi:hypothetical protein